MKKSKTFVLISLLFFLIKFPVFSDEKSADKSKETEETIVYIESAKKTEYKKIEEEEVVIFTGDVKFTSPSQYLQTKQGIQNNTCHYQNTHKNSASTIHIFQKAAYDWFYHFYQKYSKHTEQNTTSQSNSSLKII